MGKIEIINKYVNENSKLIKYWCRSLYKGSYLSDDLFQEAYLKIVSMPDDKILKYKDHMSYMYYGVILGLYRGRRRKSSNLNGKSISYVELFEGAKVDYQPEYMSDVIEFIEKQCNMEHGFLPMRVFVETMDLSLRELSKETNINIYALHVYKKQAKEELQRLLK